MLDLAEGLECYGALGEAAGPCVRYRQSRRPRHPPRGVVRREGLHQQLAGRQQQVPTYSLVTEIGPIVNYPDSY